MHSAKQSIKLCLILTTIFIIALVAVTILLPWGVTWYVETKHRSPTLPATIMVTCYPCAPILGFALLKLRKIFKRFLKEEILTKQNAKDFKWIALCCLVISLITLIAGRFYLPFYIVGGTFVFLALVTYAMKAVILTLQEKYESEE